jgi:hypothetical protein
MKSAMTVKTFRKIFPFSKEGRSCSSPCVLMIQREAGQEDMSLQLCDIPHIHEAGQVTHEIIKTHSFDCHTHIELELHTLPTDVTLACISCVLYMVGIT